MKQETGKGMEDNTVRQGPFLTKIESERTRKDP